METSKVLEREFEWFESVVNASLTLYFQNECEVDSIYELSPPEFGPSNSSYAQFIEENKLGFEERIILALALIHHLKPQSLDVFLIKNQHLNCDFSEFGGVKDNSANGFVPTINTASFILSGSSLELRMQFMKNFDESHFFFKSGILKLDSEQDFSLDQALSVSNEYLHLLITGKKVLPQYNSRFPAKEISTKLDWNDLVVETIVQDQITEIMEWLKHSDLILKQWGLSKTLKSGYRALFHGPPGTGKTFAATLLGKATERPVFRVDLSMVVSKYIGETEKNLGRLFDEAENKHWILFFDEADALFGKRTQTKGANDRYANQEVAYLLQRIEDFSGLVILATNLNSNIDEAFSRRFQSMVYFPKPGAKERKKLWKNLLLKNFELENPNQLEEIAEKYELSGGEMINVLRYCAIQAAKREERTIRCNDILVGIRREYNKSNKTI